MSKFIICADSSGVGGQIVCAVAGIIAFNSFLTKACRFSVCRDRSPINPVHRDYASFKLQLILRGSVRTS